MPGGSPNITVLDASSGVVKGVVQQNANPLGMGSLDAAADRTWLYNLRGGAYLSVSQLGDRTGGLGEEVQFYNLTGLGSRQGFMGMAIFGN